MATPYTSTSAPPAVPATREFSAAWIAYVAYAFSMVLFWPAIIGLIINYSKRGHAEAGFIDSHHRWMLRSFWWSQLAFLVFFILVLAGMWPLISDIVMQAIQAGGNWDDANANVAIHVNWSSIFGTVGAAMFGAIGFLATWLWYLYRVVRGMVALADARAMP